jgi:hypothetical protein
MICFQEKTSIKDGGITAKPAVAVIWSRVRAASWCDVKNGKPVASVPALEVAQGQQGPRRPIQAARNERREVR